LTRSQKNRSIFAIDVFLHFHKLRGLEMYPEM